MWRLQLLLATPRRVLRLVSVAVLAARPLVLSLVPVLALAATWLSLARLATCWSSFASQSFVAAPWLPPVLMLLLWGWR